MDTTTITTVFEGDEAETSEELEPMPSYEELQREYEEQKEEEEQAA